MGRVERLHAFRCVLRIRKMSHEMCRLRQPKRIMEQRHWIWEVTWKTLSGRLKRKFEEKHIFIYLGDRGMR